jgi:uncharacterized SAM-binding protein YcdF (DUF218 family)
LVVLLLPLLLAVGLVVTPAESEAAGSSDVVAVLAGERERLPVAVQTAEAGSGVLVVSLGPGPGNAAARRLCQAPGELTVHCFEPSPATTRGEAQAIGRLVEDHGWQSLTLVSSTYHLTRARVLVERCSAVDVRLKGAQPSASVGDWASFVGHELGGLAKAAFVRDC